MKRLMVLCFGFALAVTLVTLAASSGIPEAEANDCFCFGAIKQTAKTGMGETCPEATANLDFLLSEGNLCGIDGFCYDEGITITQACYPGSGPGAWVKIDGYRRYKCQTCI